jgi:hypothetical protein
MKDYIGRIVTFVVTPLVGGITAWAVPYLSDHLPGHPNLDKDQLTLLGIAGVVAFGGAVYKWLDNLGKHERGESA